MAEERKWTDAQKAAIHTRGKTILVSAAAGSGKTATLTERIIRSITRTPTEENPEPPADISRLLVVTFTRASAADLKVKISAALADALAKDPTNEHLASQIMLLGSAKISTIDSFYFDLLKNNFQKLSLPGNLRVMESAEKAILYRAIMEEIIDDFYEKEPDFENFADHFADIRSTDQLGDIFISIYEKLLSYRDGVDLLDMNARGLLDAAKHDFFATPYGQTAKAELVASLSYVRSVLQTAEAYFEDDATLSQKYLPAFRHDRTAAEDILACVERDDYTAARSKICEHEFLRLGTVKNCDEYTERLKDLRKKTTALLRSLRDTFFLYSVEEIAEYMKETAAVCETAFRFLSAFDKKLLAEKIQRGLCDFSDIRRFVMDLILDKNGDPTPLALELREQFDEIYIDEYQDTDEVQDLIFRTIAKNNRFLVGDIKQSIYSFRGADPSIFASYKRTMPLLGTAPSDACSIFMSNNYRCDENVIRFSNLVSSYLFRHCGESIEYSSHDDLIFSKKPPAEDYRSPKVILAIADKRGDATESDPAEEEANETEETTEVGNAQNRYVVQEIKRLLTQRKADGTPIRPSDIAILMRSKLPMADLMDDLLRAGIPAYSAEETSFFENPDVLLILSLLSTIDNPQRDVPLAGALCSPFYGFTLDDLVVIRKDGEENMSLYDALEAYAETENALGEKCRAFLASLTFWRDRARALPVDRLLREIYRSFSVLSVRGTSEKNLRRLYEYARGFESGGFRGLYGFIRYVHQVIDSGAKISSESGESTIDAVHLMTIHHSKGLEFPVCFIYNTSARFSTRFRGDRIQFDPTVGIGFCLHDKSGLGYYDTPIRQAIINQKSNLQREDEMRILYVAMTRARERLYVTGTVNDYEKCLASAGNLCEFGKAYGIIKSNSFLEWILASIHDFGGEKAAADFLEIKVFSNADLDGEEAAPDLEDSTNPPDVQEEIRVDEDLAECLRKRFSFSYPYEHVSNLPAKLSVSSLYPAVLDESGEAILDEASYEELLSDAFRMPEKFSLDKPVTGADRGTATHTFLQFCDFEKAATEGVDEELARLTERRFIAPDTEKLVNRKQLCTFFESDLFNRIRRAKTVYREQRFNLFLPASEFTEHEEKAALLADETIAVQGVIDLFFMEEDGTVVLCDYKTDYLTREELAAPPLAAAKLQARHAQQLSYYAKAIEAMLGKAPDEVLIYSLPLGDSVKISW